MQPVEMIPAGRVGRMRNHLRECIRTLTGKDQVDGIEIANLVRLIATKYESMGEPYNPTANISGPRWGLLLRLLSEEDQGNANVTPTYLSRCQHVSKNTISALLRGLEDQNLISRHLDPDDRRIFRIRLTSNGHRTIREIAPQHIERLNQLVAGLSPQEQAHLTHLLAKLYRSMVEATQSMEVE